MSVETYANILCVVSFSAIDIYHTLRWRESENLKPSFSQLWKMGWRQSEGSFQHVLPGRSPFSRPTRARPCALLRPFIIDYVLSCNKASQSNRPNKSDWNTELHTKNGAAAISHQTLRLRRSRWWAKPWMVQTSEPHLLINWHQMWQFHSKSEANQCHAAFCRVFVLTFEGVSPLAGWIEALARSICVSHGVEKWKWWQSKTQEVLPAAS